MFRVKIHQCKYLTEAEFQYINSVIYFVCPLFFPQTLRYFVIRMSSSKIKDLSFDLSHSHFGVVMDRVFKSWVWISEVALSNRLNAC